jgi:lysozyme family protein
MLIPVQQNRGQPMKSITEIADEIVTREGGFVDDPDDAGGPTNRGVTLKTLRALGRDLNGDGKVSLADLRLLSRDQARDIFLQQYYQRPGIARLPQALQPSVFDMYVNAGAAAVRLLQRLLVDMGQRVSVDGVLGPETEQAAAVAHAAAPAHLVDAYGIARRNFYYALADKRVKSRKFARRRDGSKGGWILRAESFMSPRYHLSAAEHAARVAPWA